MENSSDIKPETDQAMQVADSESIHLLDTRQFIIKDELELVKLNEEYTLNMIGSVYLKGIQYYDLKNINFINNMGIANLIELLKSLLKNEVEVQFVNVNEKIKNKIMSMGLDHILICD